MVDYIISQGWIYRRSGGGVERKYLLDFCNDYRVGINSDWEPCFPPNKVKKALFLQKKHGFTGILWIFIENDFHYH